ncbi:23S rRNA (pseudouridine(1915)-N(3))-methyltransferase RlmH [uncultured Mailhella sp.]|uniref:23S rRNA (pseudouridine(1915)-N(3))-methyltransferase RlmH n=1 Tax=uncultured Mailhella sp. TaxID=1981031 RepID=UPI00262E7CAC|nr:23S rRNA (pseudouridine(1915)-N(3))-methyltransferase RlmH [uncultured Mailhella sp.]
MSLRPLRIITVGRPRASFWKEAAAHYLERLVRWRQVTDTIIRDADPALPIAGRIEDEGRRILAALEPQDVVVCLDEQGRSLTSREFSRFLDGMSTDGTRRPCFIIGGPFGLHASVRERARSLLAFGPQTFPHELARVVLLEQLYRAETLLRRIPYHHD